MSTQVWEVSSGSRTLHGMMVVIWSLPAPVPSWRGQSGSGHAQGGWLGSRGHPAPPLQGFVPGPPPGPRARPQGRAPSWGTMPPCSSRWKGGRGRMRWDRHANRAGGRDPGRASPSDTAGAGSFPEALGGWGRGCREACEGRARRRRDHTDQKVFNGSRRELGGIKGGTSRG